MKKLLFILIVSCAAITARSQSLVFSKVIDTVLTASFNVCTDLTTPFVGASITVPAGKVWKVEAIGPLSISGSTTLYTNCNYQGGSSNRAYWGITIFDGQVQKGYLKRRVYNSSTGSYSDQALNGIAWLAEGTSLQAEIGTTTPPYSYANGEVFSIETFLSIIEFTVQP